MNEHSINDELIEPTAHHVTYGNYLKIPELLSLQKPLSQPPEHDETLFIIIHQVYELWFKQILHELAACEQHLHENQLIPFLAAMKRITTIQEILTHQVDVLETMTPNDFNRFRNHLNPASGFQSLQFRILEFKLGMKNKQYLKFHKYDPQAYALLEKALGQPTIYDAFLAYLKRRDFNVPAAVLNRDFSSAYESHPEIVEIYKEIYLHSTKHQDIYRALETLMDFDQKLLLWRYRHVAMVARMIGDNRGTGGSSGATYLYKTLEKRCFPEIWQVRNHLVNTEPVTKTMD